MSDLVKRPGESRRELNKDREKHRRRISPVLTWAIVSTLLALVVLVCFTVLIVKIVRMPGGSWKEVIGSDSVPAVIVEELAGEDISDETEAAAISDNGEYLDAKKAAEDSLLQRLRGYMEEEGVSTVEVLRTLFPNQLVVYSNDRYYFEEIDHSLPSNEYGDSYFTENADGTWSYEDDNGVIGHPGIDVSRFQGDIDWEKVAASGIEFAVMRLGFRGYTEGAIVPDETFEANITGALEQKLHAGVYFLTQAKDADEIDEEADYVLDTLKDYEIDGPVVLDVENVANDSRTNSLSKEERTALIRRFVDRITDAGYKPMLYTNLKSMILLMNYRELADIPLWYAFYSRPIYFPYDYDILQYSETGRVDGIAEPVDLDLAMKPWWED
ncbi:MAG: hypothetical protein E7300_00360 [Lachnospiraceae bacterium]|nr:hypothetical protein [Lachnospiraceae bacterium]